MYTVGLLCLGCFYDCYVPWQTPYIVPVYCQNKQSVSTRTYKPRFQRTYWHNLCSAHPEYLVLPRKLFAFELFFCLANAFDTSNVITNAWFSMKNYRNTAYRNGPSYEPFEERNVYVKVENRIVYTWSLVEVRDAAYIVSPPLK